MVTLSEAFSLAAGTEEEAILKNSGITGLHILFAGTFFPMSVADLEELYEKETLPADTSFTWEEFTTFATQLGWQLEEETKKKADATLLLVIEERAKRLEFPLVHPEEMIGSVAPEEAKDIICLGRKVNSAALQTIVESEWDKYQQGPMEHATFGTWVHQYYHTGCRKFVPNFP